MKPLLLKFFGAVTLLAVLAVIYIVWNEREGDADSPLAQASPAASLPDQQIRGAYLARAGNCAGCHTAQGGQAYAGGRELPTPFGTFITPNITADRNTGIGAWTAQDFWRAMHHGKGRDGKLLYPAFPYTEYTKVTRADSDALFSYLQTLAPVAQAAAVDRLQLPYNVRALLYVWRALYFKPGVYEPVANQTAEWNRGAYLYRDWAIATPATRLGMHWVPPVALRWVAARWRAVAGTRHRSPRAQRREMPMSQWRKSSRCYPLGAPASTQHQAQWPR